MELNRNHERLIESIARWSDPVLKTHPYVDTRSFATRCEWDHPQMGEIERDLVVAGYIAFGECSVELTAKGWTTAAAARGKAAW